MRKNNTKQSLIMPKSPFYTVENLFELNFPRMVKITIRVRLSQKLESNEIAEIGYLTGGQGRPKKVYASMPITQTTLDLAKSQNINLVENVTKLVNVMNIKSKPVDKLSILHPTKEIVTS